MNDEMLVELSYDIDGELNRLVHDYKTTPLELSGVVLARLARFLMDFDQLEDFNKLMRHACEITNDRTAGEGFLQ